MGQCFPLVSCFQTPGTNLDPQELGPLSWYKRPLQGTWPPTVLPAPAVTRDKEGTPEGPQRTWQRLLYLCSYSSRSIPAISPPPHSETQGCIYSTSLILTNREKHDVEMGAWLSLAGIYVVS